MAKKKILVADNDPDILEVTTMALEQTGQYEVISTTDKRSVLNLRSDFPDLILLDVWSSSWEEYKSLKEKKATRELPLVVFSTNMNIEKISNSIGADDYLSKPFDLHLLLEKIDRLTH